MKLPAPLHSLGSSARAWATVAACAVVATCALSAGCLVNQELGADEAGVRPDARAADGGSSEGGFDPQLTSVDYDVSKCPGVTPKGGQLCPKNFLDKRDHLPVQCTYGASIQRFGADGVLRQFCGVSCMCGVDQTWSCIDAPCTYPMRTKCSEGTACLAGFECSYDCEGEGIGCQRCGCVDQRLSCTRVPTK